MTYSHDSTSTIAVPEQARPLLSRTIARLLLASTLGGVAYIGASPPPALGFECVGNTGGALVGGNPSTPATASGAGADDGGSTLNTACGPEANAAGANSTNVAIGRQADASIGPGTGPGHNVAVGSGSNASGGGTSHNIAIGFNNNANTISTGDNIAVGSFARARGERGKNIAIGRFSNASGDDAENTAIGANATATGANASAFGSSASATHSNSAAFGQGATTSRADQQVFGTGTNTYTMAGITSAASATAQGAPTRIVTSNEAGDLAARSVVELGLATSDDISELQGKATDNMMAIQDNAAAIQSNSAAIGRNRQDIDTNREGVALAAALSGSASLRDNEYLAVSFDWGTFDGEHAGAVSGIAHLGSNLLGAGDSLYLKGGVGFSSNEAAGRAGVMFAFK